MLKYIIVLFLFDLSPGVSFAIVVRNVIKSKSLKIGLITAFGIAVSDGISGLLAFFGCDILLKVNPRIFLYLRSIGIMYLLYLSLKMLRADVTKIKIDKNLISKFSAFYGGFIFTFSNIAVILSIASIFSQFIEKNMSLYMKLIYVILIPIISFTSFALIACMARFSFFKSFLEKYNNILDKIAGIAIMILVAREMPELMIDFQTLK